MAYISTKIYFIVTLVIVISLLYYFNRLLQAEENEIANELSEQRFYENVLTEELRQRNIPDKKLFNITLKYNINPAHICGDNTTEILAIFIITSYFGNVETRSAMRRSFSNDELRKMKFRRVFLLGEAPNDKFTTQRAIYDENKKFGDIVQGNFLEAYKNLTYKHIMGLKWVASYCNHSKYVVKMDDDIVVDIQRLPRLLHSFKVPKYRDFLAGYVLRNMTPVRNVESKWYVSDDEYEQNKYPKFLSGWFYVTTPKTALKFDILANYVPYFWIDDLYVTGILGLKLRIKHYDIGKYFTPHSEFLECCIRDVEKSKVKCDILVGPNGGDNNLFYKFNKAMELCNSLQCHSREKPINSTCVAEKKNNIIGRGESLVEMYRLH